MSAIREDLLVVMDVGNTQTVVGVFDGDRLAGQVRLSTAPERTTDEYGALLTGMFGRFGVEAAAVGGVAISSVVPPLNSTFAELSQRYLGCEPLFVEPGVRTGLAIRYDNPLEVGADRIVNSVAARTLYGTPVVVVDFGTATSFDVVNAAGEYVGGLIAPGLGISAEALFAHASRLQRVDLRPPDDLIGRTTVGAMQSGLYYGYVGLVDGILERLAAELSGLRRIVATGGLAPLIAGGSRFIQETRQDLTLLGLKLIHERNR